MTTRYEGIFLELLRCTTLSQMLATLAAHREQVDPDMLRALIDDDRFEEFHVDLLVGVLKSNAGEQ
jgi:hypothetical protein